MALGSSPHLPVSVCGTGAFHIHIPFLATMSNHFATKFRSLSPESTNARVDLSYCVSIFKCLAATEYLPFVHRLRLSASP